MATANRGTNGRNWSGHQDRSPDLHLPVRGSVDTTSPAGIPFCPAPWSGWAPSGDPDGAGGGLARLGTPAGSARALPGQPSPSSAKPPLPCPCWGRDTPGGFPTGFRKKKVENGAFLPRFSTALVRVSLCPKFGGPCTLHPPWDLRHSGPWVPIFL